MTCDIFIKSYPADYEWLAYCMRSIDKFCTGFRQIVIVAPTNDCPSAAKIPVKLLVHAEQDASHGYLNQQVVKLQADMNTDADHILFVDSDNIFIRNVTPDTFVEGGKVKWLHTPWDCAREDQQVWRPVMDKFCKASSESEMMRRHPFMFPRWIFVALRDFTRHTHGRSLDGYIMSQPGHAFSEFNCAGFYAWLHHHDKFVWQNTEMGLHDADCIKQFWSYAGVNKHREEIEAILA